MKKDTYLVKSAEIAHMEGLSKTHFLNSNAKRKNISLGDLTGLTGIGIHLIEVEPGHETTEYHVHNYEDEAVYVLEGHATAIVGETQYSVGAGDFIGYRKGGHAHTIRNTGSTVLRCLVIGERLSHDVVDYPNQAKRLYRNKGMDWDLIEHDAISHPKAGAKK